MGKLLQCEHCLTYSVCEIGNGFWKCSNCMELKKWDSTCNQGWVRHLKIKGKDFEFYTCDECDATWEKLDEAGTKPASLSFEPYVKALAIEPLWGNFEIIRDFFK